jgi:hypothetical protein
MLICQTTPHMADHWWQQGRYPFVIPLHTCGALVRLDTFLGSVVPGSGFHCESPGVLGPSRATVRTFFLGYIVVASATFILATIESGALCLCSHVVHNTV